MRFPFALLGLLGLLAMTGCGDSPTEPTAPTSFGPVTELFAGTASTDGTSFFSFTVSQAGTVSVMLATVTGANGLPLSRALQLGLGVPSGTICGVATSVTATAALVAQLSSTRAAGIHCVNVVDPSGAIGPANFSIRIVHP